MVILNIVLIETPLVFAVDTLRCYFGEWVKDRTAGGQIRFNSFSKNPQYGLTVEGEFYSHVHNSLYHHSQRLVSTFERSKFGQLV